MRIVRLIQAFVPSDSSAILALTVMDGAYEFDSHPFFFNRATNVRLYHGFSLNRGRIPVVIKRHDIYLVDKPQFLEDFNHVINAGLAQARADHSNACKIIEIRIDTNPVKTAIPYFTFWRLWRRMWVEK